MSIKKLVFGSRYGNNERVFSNPGERFKDELSAKYNEAGELIFEVVGKTDLYLEIQSHKEECDLKLIMQRFANGETDVLQKVQGFYADVSDMPSSNFEILNRVIHAEQFFDSLPVEFKKKFGNSYEKFLASVDDQDFLELFSSDHDVVEDMKSEIEEGAVDES